MSLELKSYVILLVLSVVGGLGLLRSSRKEGAAKKRENRDKYLYYLLLIAVMVLAIHVGAKLYLPVVLVITALCGYELYRVTNMLRIKGELRWRFWVIFIYTILFASFLFSSFIGSQMQLFLYVNVVVFDAFSQVCGQLFGKHKLAPRLSPAKTWEGLAGGAAVMAVVFYLLYDFTTLLPAAALYSFVLLLALAGDLFASAVKRKAGLKDFSALLPGQGGFMDRFDSLVFVMGVYGLIQITVGLFYMFGMPTPSAIN
jgi:phosphatidate cytidylyltransferase